MLFRSAPTAWHWDFGDGTTSTLQNPSHTYTAMGTYPVSLTVSHAADEQTETRAGYITADYQFTAAFTLNATSGIVPMTVQFTSTTDTSVATPTGYLWNFGDGTTSNEQNPIHVYTQPGTFDVSLTVYGIQTQNTRAMDGIVHAGILRPRATEPIDNVSTSLVDDLINSLGGETVPEPGNDTINWTGLISTIGGAYTSVLGPLAYTLIFSIPFLMMWITQRDMTLPGLVGALFGLFIIVRLPAEFHLVAVTFIAISIVAVVYSLVKERV